MKGEMSSFDVLAVVRALKELKGAYINKVFQISPDEQRIQLNAPGKGRLDLAIHAGRWAYITKHPKPAPQEASTFSMTLRKHLGNAVLEDVEQVSFDRIIVLRCRRELAYSLIIELFGNGNVVLTDQNGDIAALLRVERFKDRDLLPKKKYALPPGKKNPFECSENELLDVVNNSGTDLVRALARGLGMGGLYAEEVCLRSGLAKDKKGITIDEASRIRNALAHLLDSLNKEKPRIVLDEGKPIDVIPIALESYRDKAFKEFVTFNDALDEYFGGFERAEAVEEVNVEFKSAIEKLESRLKDQEALVEKNKATEKSASEFGDLIYSRLMEIEGLLSGLREAKDTSSWEEISKALKSGKADFQGAGLVKRLLPKEGVVVLEIEGKELRLDVRKSAAANAEQYYNQSKKSREKVRGAEAAAQETRRLIEELKQKGIKSAETVARPPKRAERKRHWYEKFRWFTSSDGILVIGGRDAGSNEIVVKRHMQSGDIFVHADIQGAPAVVVKAEGKSVPDTTIKEAFDFAASYSKAWKHSVASLDVYWVKPEQVSKTAESGEYVARGAFVIRGKKNFGKGAVQLAIGVKLDDQAQVLGGPPSVVEKQCSYSVRIVPGKKVASEMAKEIKDRLTRMAKDDQKERVLGLPLDEFQAFLPSGGSNISEK